MAAEVDNLDEAIADLYRGDPDQFIPTRDALAKKLRGEGRTDDAASVRALRKPNLAAWAVDQLAFRHPDELDRLIDAGRRLEEQQDKVLSGADRAGLQQATEARRRLVAALTAYAADALRERGKGNPDTQRDAIESTLEAASVDPDVAAEAIGGRLVADAPRPVWFGGAIAGGVVEKGPTKSRPAQAAKQGEAEGGAGVDAAELEGAKEEAQRLEKVAAEAATAATEADEGAEAAMKEVERLEAALSTAVAAAKDARQEAKDRRAEAAAARRDADRAATRVTRLEA